MLETQERMIKWFKTVYKKTPWDEAHKPKPILNSVGDLTYPQRKEYQNYWARLVAYRDAVGEHGGANVFQIQKFLNMKLMNSKELAQFKEALSKADTKWINALEG